MRERVYIFSAHPARGAAADKVRSLTRIVTCEPQRFECFIWLSAGIGLPRAQLYSIHILSFAQ